LTWECICVNKCFHFALTNYFISKSVRFSGASYIKEGLLRFQRLITLVGIRLDVPSVTGCGPLQNSPIQITHHVTLYFRISTLDTQSTWLSIYRKKIWMIIKETTGVIQSWGRNRSFFGLISWPEEEEEEEEYFSTLDRLHLYSNPLTASSCFPVTLVLIYKKFNLKSSLLAFQERLCSMELVSLVNQLTLLYYLEEQRIFKIFQFQTELYLWKYMW